MIIFLYASFSPYIFGKLKSFWGMLKFFGNVGVWLKLPNTPYLYG